MYNLNCVLVYANKVFVPETASPCEAVQLSGIPNALLIRYNSDLENLNSFSHSLWDKLFSKKGLLEYVFLVSPAFNLLNQQ